MLGGPADACLAASVKYYKTCGHFHAVRIVGLLRLARGPGTGPGVWRRGARVVPADIYVPGGHGTAEELLYGIMQVQRLLRRSGSIER